MKWRVRTEADGNNIRVYAQQNLSQTYGIIVRPLNFIDKWRGITFDQKLDRAKMKMQKQCDKWNYIIEVASK